MYLRHKDSSNLILDPDDPAEVNNLNNPTDIRKMDFGAPRDLHDVVDADTVNFAPRAGFAWTVDGAGRTVLRGGVGVFTTGHIMKSWNKISQC